MFHPQGPSFLELAQQALSSTERGYDLLAPKFDHTPFRTPQWLLQAVAPHIGAPASLEFSLDVCCGTGAAVRMLRPLTRRCVVGIDFSQRMLEMGRQRTRDAAGSARLEFVRGNVLDLPLAPRFDVAVCFGALGHIRPRDEARFVRQLAGALKPGGRFVTVTSAMPPPWSREYWLSRGFNTAMHVRNWLITPPFIMYYLTFLLPRARTLLEQCGFDVQVIDEPALRHGRLKIVVATRRD